MIKRNLILLYENNDIYTNYLLGSLDLDYLVNSIKDKENISLTELTKVVKNSKILVLRYGDSYFVKNNDYSIESNIDDFINVACIINNTNEVKEFVIKNSFNLSNIFLSPHEIVTLRSTFKLIEDHEIDEAIIEYVIERTGLHD